MLFRSAHDIRPNFVLSSPIRRAHQTATEVANHLKSELVTVRWLACGATPEVILEQLDEYKLAPAVMIVGHEPDFSNLAGALLGSSIYGAVHVRKASLILIEVPQLTTGYGRLEFSIPVKLM